MIMPIQLLLRLIMIMITITIIMNNINKRDNKLSERFATPAGMHHVIGQLRCASCPREASTVQWH